jgi:hypothetical protein
MDQKQGKSNTYSYGQTYAVLYDSSNQLYPSSFGTQGSGMKVGETVEVVVDLAKGNVEFKVGENVRAKVNNYNILKEANREFVPYIETLYQNDCVEWLGGE